MFALLNCIYCFFSLSYFIDHRNVRENVNENVNESANESANGRMERKTLNLCGKRHLSSAV